MTQLLNLEKLIQAILAAYWFVKHVYLAFIAKVITCLGTAKNNPLQIHRLWQNLQFVYNKSKIHKEGCKTK